MPSKTDRRKPENGQTPFYDRPAEWRLYQPLIGASMLELGNKKNRYRTYKAFFESLRFRHVSVDWNGEDGALALDLRQPLELGTFDMISNIGTTEHVSEQEPVWRNIAQAMHIGSVLVSHTPLLGDWWWHGEWYPTADWYRAFAAANGLRLDRLSVERQAPLRVIHARMTRTVETPFQMPAVQMYRNVIRPR